MELRLRGPGPLLVARRPSRRCRNIHPLPLEGKRATRGAPPRRIGTTELWNPRGASDRRMDGIRGRDRVGPRREAPGRSLPRRRSFREEPDARSHGRGARGRADGPDPEAGNRGRGRGPLGSLRPEESAARRSHPVRIRRAAGGSGIGAGPAGVRDRGADRAARVRGGAAGRRQRRGHQRRRDSCPS
jgi:hypothetical protein